jgi:hypothetical protein
MSTYRVENSHDQLSGCLNAIKGLNPGETETGQASQTSSARKLDREPNLTAGTTVGNTDESGDGLSTIEIQAMGRLVPLYNTHNCDRVEASGSETASPKTAEIIKATETNGEDAHWRTAVKRMLSRETLSGSIKAPSRRWHARRKKRHGFSTRFPGVDPQITRLKKRPSVFLRILNRTVKKNQSYTGYNPILADMSSILHWGRSIIAKASIVPLFKSDDIGHHHPQLIEEVLRYFGSDAIKKQLVFTSASNSMGSGGIPTVIIHHPINLRILDARQQKMDQECRSQGKPATWAKKSFLSLRKSRLSSASQIRIINRHGENWKLLGFSKMATPKIGDGQLSLSGEYPELKSCQSIIPNARRF